MQVVDRLISYVGCGPVSGAGGARALCVAKQKAQVGAQSFVLEEIYGLSTNSQTGECVVCLCEPPSTTIFPCRHLVVCAECAATLRLQGHASRCPVCRCRIESLLNLTASA